MWRSAVWALLVGFCGLAGTLGEATNSKALSIQSVPSSSYVNGSFDVVVSGPAGARSKLSLSLVVVGGGGEFTAPSAQLDGQSPNSTAVFRNVHISGMGRYRVSVASKDPSEGLENATSEEVRVLPEVQCNGKRWNDTVSCDDCVSLVQFSCAYCSSLGACVEADWFGPKDRDACGNYNLNVCFVPGLAVVIGVPSVLGLVILLLALCCFLRCRQRRLAEEDRLMAAYDRRFGLDSTRRTSTGSMPRSPPRQYGSVPTGTSSNPTSPSRGRQGGNSRPSEGTPRTDEHRSRMHAKYGISPSAADTAAGPSSPSHR